MLQIDPNDRLDINDVLAHPALKLFQTLSPLSSEEYQILLRNYLLNTQGATNRDVPDEIERFISTYNEITSNELEKVNQTSLQDPPNVQFQERNKIVKEIHNSSNFENESFKSPKREDFFDNIEKVIEQEHSSVKPKIFKKSEFLDNKYQSINGFDETKLNHKVEKMTNYFENVQGEELTGIKEDIRVVPLIKNQPTNEATTFISSTSEKTSSSKIIHKLETKIEQNTELPAATFINAFSYSLDSKEAPSKTETLYNFFQPINSHELTNDMDKETDKTKKFESLSANADHQAFEDNKSTNNECFLKFNRIDKINLSECEKSKMGNNPTPNTDNSSSKTQKLIISSLLNRSIMTNYNGQSIKESSELASLERKGSESKVKYSLNSSPKKNSAPFSTEHQSIKYTKAYNESKITNTKAPIEFSQFINARIEPTQLSLPKLTASSLKNESPPISTFVSHIDARKNSDFSENQAILPIINVNKAKGITEDKTKKPLQIETHHESLNLTPVTCFNTPSSYKKYEEYSSIKFANSDLTRQKEPSFYNPSQYSKLITPSNQHLSSNFGSRLTRSNSDAEHDQSNSHIHSLRQIASPSTNKLFVDVPLPTHDRIINNQNKTTLNSFVNHNDSENNKYVATISQIRSGRNISLTHSTTEDNVLSSYKYKQYPKTLIKTSQNDSVVQVGETFIKPITTYSSTANTFPDQGLFSKSLLNNR
jgi:hypothetical protein